MLSDEITTGSVTSTEAEKRAFAARSHAWNIAQSRFKEAFPDVRVLFPRFVFHPTRTDLAFEVLFPRDPRSTEHGREGAWV